ncbi:MAG: HD domain-containing protein [Mesorhizobium sp.]|nr:MAG: HD domain-containing protein [Mesorhizobium sp.]
MQSSVINSIRDAFSPYGSLAASLLPKLDNDSDGSHDLAHIVRVWGNVQVIQAEEGGNLDVLIAACLLHDCVSVEKNSPLRSQASCLAATRAQSLLLDENWEPHQIEAVRHAIEAHSFSARIEPRSLEARILQDADRLDAIGAVGVARCFYVSGRLRQAFYDLSDPDAKGRPYDDSRYALDHFHTKLLSLASGFKTVTGVQLARIRHDKMLRFVDEFRKEAGIISHRGSAAI